MYYSITFIDPEGNALADDDPRKRDYIKNTFDDWHIVPSSRPLFSMPSMKGKFIELPGSDGSIDLSEAITGYPVYANRTGSWEFIVLNGFGEWHDRYSMIADFIHGKKMRAFLEDTPDWYYEGRFSLNEWRSEKDWSRIVIEYSVDAYKWNLILSSEPWLWDPFSFVNGIVGNGLYVDSGVEPPVIWQGAGLFAGIPVKTTGTQLLFKRTDTGSAPLEVIFTAGSAYDIILQISNTLTTLSETVAAGTSEAVTGLVLYNGKWLYDGHDASVVAVSDGAGDSSLTLSFRMGRLG